MFERAYVSKALSDRIRCKKCGKPIEIGGPYVSYGWLFPDNYHRDCGDFLLKY